MVIQNPVFNETNRSYYANSLPVQDPEQSQRYGAFFFNRRLFTDGSGNHQNLRLPASTRHQFFHLLSTPSNRVTTGDLGICFAGETSRYYWVKIHRRIHTPSFISKDGACRQNLPPRFSGSPDVSLSRITSS